MQVSAALNKMNTGATLTNLYIKHFGELRAFLLRRVGCREMAAELTHDTFIRVMSYDAGEQVQNSRALLYRIAGNLAIDHHRANPILPECIDDLHENEQLATDLHDPARVACARQTLDRLRMAIEDLPPQCRRAFVLHKFDGHSHAEIAEIFGVTRNAVEKLLIRALVQLRQVFA